MYQIKKELLQAIGRYLTSRPYNEVFQLVEQLRLTIDANEQSEESKEEDNGQQEE